MAGSGYLGAEDAPFAVQSDARSGELGASDLAPHAALTDSRLARRRELLRAFDAYARAAEGRLESASAAGVDRPSLEKAFRLLTSPEAKRAFDLSEESEATRARYGQRVVGQACLAARRLVERGVPFVTVTDRGWDTHEDLKLRLAEGYTGGSVGKVPILDQALAALVTDLEERGLLDSTLVLVLGEFGRTPKLNTRGGRDHWPRVFSAALAGGGTARGAVVGRSDSFGESPADRPVSPSDLAATVLELLGIDPRREVTTPDGRPVLLVRDGTAIRELLA
jgi:uncharacterized protein (DUF1501 family)